MAGCAARGRKPAACNPHRPPPHSGGPYAGGSPKSRFQGARGEPLARLVRGLRAERVFRTAQTQPTGAGSSCADGPGLVHRISRVATAGAGREKPVWGVPGDPSVWSMEVSGTETLGGGGGDRGRGRQRLRMTAVAVLTVYLYREGYGVGVCGGVVKRKGRRTQAPGRAIGR